MNSFPDEILFYIFTFLTVSELFKIKPVSKRFYSILKDQSLFETVLTNLSIVRVESLTWEETAEFILWSELRAQYKIRNKPFYNYKKAKRWAKKKMTDPNIVVICHVFDKYFGFIRDNGRIFTWRMKFYIDAEGSININFNPMVNRHPMFWQKNGFEASPKLKNSQLYHIENSGNPGEGRIDAKIKLPFYDKMVEYKFVAVPNNPELHPEIFEKYGYISDVEVVPSGAKHLPFFLVSKEF